MKPHGASRRVDRPYRAHGHPPPRRARPPSCRACHPRRASPSTPARPSGPSSAGSSAGRASSRGGCPRCARAPTRCSRRVPPSPTAPGTPGSRRCCPCAAAARPRCCARPTWRRWRPRARSWCCTTRAVLRHPEWYSRAYAAWQRALLPLIARRALHVVTVSEFSRAELIELLGLPAGRISVVPGGVADAFSAPARPARRGRPYVLCVASHTARKNLGALVPAARALRPRGHRRPGRGRPPAAVRCPNRGWTGCACSVTFPTPTCPGSTRARRRSCCPRATRASACRCSRRWPRGRRCSRPPRGALPDTCGGAARLVSPDPEALRAGLVDLLADDAGRARLRAAGRAHAARYSWDRTARAVDALLERVAG